MNYLFILQFSPTLINGIEKDFDFYIHFGIERIFSNSDPDQFQYKFIKVTLEECENWFLIKAYR